MKLLIEKKRICSRDTSSKKEQNKEHNIAKIYKKVFYILESKYALYEQIKWR